MYRPNRMGWKIVEQPAQAHAELTALFKKHKEVRAVAKKMGVDRDTIRRWANRLVQAGYSDPRVIDGGPEGQPQA